ncbi:hypothetical protein A3Q56_08699 [Intoshia linei]|uniref:IFT121-like zinc finger domain-containing protein n=1 Tax=Intoshia linei TaxID=1819745 RepID=A0A177AQE0_9BILA|nr:hypothetical protein A3Q56_08699 [Intoshia linei]
MNLRLKPSERTIVCPTCNKMLYPWEHSCESCSTKFELCISSGQPIVDQENLILCDTCRRKSIASYRSLYNFCPLCHD